MSDWVELPQLVGKLKIAVERPLAEFDSREVKALVDDLVERTKGTDELMPESSAEDALQLLRKRRLFADMERLGDALIQSGIEDPIVRTLYAQSLIDQQKLTAAEPLLEMVARDAQTPKQKSEAHGLLGRLFKQRYVVDRGTPERRAKLLQRSFSEYAEGEKVNYDPLWHGINLVAVAARGRRDGIPPPDARFDELARARELIALSRQGEQQHWKPASRMEAFVALGQWEDALQAGKEYVSNPTADFFALSATLRQLREIWQISPGDAEPRAALVALLSSEALKRDRGELLLDSADVRALQRNFTNEPGQSVEWLRTALRRCEAVARIQTEAGQRIGTAFLVAGPDFGLRPKTLLLTNWHVVSEKGVFENSLAPKAAVAVFETSNQTRRIKRIAAYCRELDASFLEMEEPLAPAPLPCPLVPKPDAFNPEASPPQHVYVIGHPWGGRLTFSLHDSVWLDADSDTLHYRTPTDPGSSGSPVFDEKNWTLIALHHAGSKDMKKLHGRTGTYEANEGHAISAIARAVKASPKS